jgi:hypothetical protein
LRLGHAESSHGVHCRDARIDLRDLTVAIGKELRDRIVDLIEQHQKYLTVAHAVRRHEAATTSWERHPRQSTPRWTLR